MVQRHLLRVPSRERVSRARVVLCHCEVERQRMKFMWKKVVRILGAEHQREQDYQERVQDNFIGVSLIILMNINLCNYRVQFTTEEWRIPAPHWVLCWEDQPPQHLAVKISKVPSILTGETEDSLKSRIRSRITFRETTRSHNLKHFQNTQG